MFVTHFLEQVYEITDRITVLRNGRLVGEYLTKDLLAQGADPGDDGAGAGGVRGRPRRR